MSGVCGSKHGYMNNHYTQHRTATTSDRRLFLMPRFRYVLPSPSMSVMNATFFETLKSSEIRQVGQTAIVHGPVIDGDS